MNKFAVVTCTNGDYLVRSEHTTKEAAFKAFHSLCATLWGDTSMAGKVGMVKVLDENLDCTENRMEFIDRSGEDAQVQAQPAEEAAEE